MKTTATIKNTLACLLLLVLANSFAAKAQVSQALADSLQAKLNALWFSHDVEGISAAAYMPGRGTWQGTAGYSYGAVPIDTDMLFNIGSITKTFVAAEILKLSEQGLLSLDDSIKDYLAPHVYMDPNITIRQLLNHTSGLGEVLGSAWQTSINTYPYRWWQPQEVIDTFLPAPQFQPGQSWAYCNTNYEVLDLIIEHIKQDSLSHVLRTDLLNPLGLNETFMHLREPFSNPVPHNWSNPNMIPGQGVDASSVPQVAASTSTSAAGGLYCSAADLAHWGHDLYSGNVISAASLQEMTTFINVNGGYFNGYGLGCMRLPYNNNTYYGHAGNFFGMAASLYYYPQDGTTVAVLVNEDCISPYIARELFNSLLQTILNVNDNDDGEQHTAISPNPASDMVSLKINAAYPGTAGISIYAVTGKKYFSNTFKLNAGENSIDIPVSELPNGLYYCETQYAGNKQTEKLLIQH